MNTLSSSWPNRRESEQKIEKLNAENEEATRAIERLQQQLKEQSEHNALKNNLMYVMIIVHFHDDYITAMIILKVTQCSLLSVQSLNFRLVVAFKPTYNGFKLTFDALPWNLGTISKSKKIYIHLPII